MKQDYRAMWEKLKDKCIELLADNKDSEYGLLLKETISEIEKSQKGDIFANDI